MRRSPASGEGEMVPEYMQPPCTTRNVPFGIVDPGVCYGVTTPVMRTTSKSLP